MTGEQVAERTWPGLLGRLVARHDLTSTDTAWAMAHVMAGETPPAVLAAFLVALRSKGETVEELSGLADAMLEAAVPISVPGRCVDIVGTGGDGHKSVNLSTMAALVAAGSGLRVVKHGNRAATSASGAADVLEALGVRLDLSPEDVAANAERVGITFCFAQVFHPSFRHAGPVRRDLGIPTSFNVLGPLTNPARPAAGSIGVADLRMAPLIAGVLARRGTDAVVARSEDGLDEWATTAPVRVWEVTGGDVVEHVVDARAAFGMSPATLDDLRGGDAAHNAGVVRAVLAGERGPVRDAVLLGAASAIVADGGLVGAGPFVDRMAQGVAIAERAIDDAAASRVLDAWVAASG
ncbi:anthranilate phosphoribosyltransferase [Beutenbergia cavernae DSM 12333]|uniref:Anthranilate phosphoribosyltransferase n=1 Tax=Beutenbergia cavernae (strain ATCC BAA-8 / DSM 12333 / CCUG 43141 / JCM 11478 / NBRC 16432 / NCIMB 13614 / HKI 0122) TaxID=471853 RepID=C5C5F9_BEUC1|nr:anthranilate phosphoribosyltransferase [Beutenbergia cavernae]ACQ80150.1 anthranilate phosphoribosyltransferase [Beutenbergia cavernae DSM 12333]